MNAIRTQQAGLEQLVEPYNRPPAHLLPKPLVKLLGEYDSVRERLSVARNALSQINTPAATEQARRADISAGAQAARTGKQLANPSENVEALEQRVADARQHVENLEAAKLLVLDDIEQAQDTERDNPKYEKDIDAARKAVSEALAVLKDQIDTLAQKVYLRGWFDQWIYGSEVQFSVADLWPRVRDLGAGRHEYSAYPIDLDTILAALESIAAEEPEDEATH